VKLFIGTSFHNFEKFIFSLVFISNYGCNAIICNYFAKYLLSLVWNGSDKVGGLTKFSKKIAKIRIFGLQILENQFAIICN